jgi:hypothetical protein
MTELTESTFTEELYNLPSQVVVIVDKEWKDVSRDEQTLLGKILVSAKQSINGVRIIHSEKALTKEFGSGTNVISFGVEFTPEVPAYTMTEANGSFFIRADSLMALDEEKKKRLWGEIKKAFSH